MHRQAEDILTKIREKEKVLSLSLITMLTKDLTKIREKEKEESQHEIGNSGVRTGKRRRKIQKKGSSTGTATKNLYHSKE